MIFPISPENLAILDRHHPISAVIDNYGTFDVNTSSDRVVTLGDSGTFNNRMNAIFNKNLSGTAQILIPFNNDGSVNLRQAQPPDGTSGLELNAGGTSSGTFDVDQSSYLQLATTAGGMAHTWNNGTKFTGDGNTILRGKAVVSTGNVTAQNFHFQEGEISGPGTLTFTRNFKWVNGTMKTQAGLTKLETEPGQQTPAMGSIGRGATSAILDGRRFINAGIITLQGDLAFQIVGGATFANNGTFKALNPSKIEGGGGSLFNNVGIFIKDGGGKPW
jgi:hypothetical protein